MESFTIIEMDPFIEQFDSLPLSEKERIERFIAQLREKGDLVGKPLGYPFLREKKFEGNRVYYLVYPEWHTIALVIISNKKEQTETIRMIKLQLDDYREYVKRELQRMKII